MESIRLDNVWEIYRVKFIIDGKTKWDNIWALKDISFSVARGEAVGIIGPNGAGKSTLLKLIAGMLAPDRGEITVEGAMQSVMISDPLRLYYTCPISDGAAAVILCLSLIHI